jgi:hypothetical protein
VHQFWRGLSSYRHAWLEVFGYETPPIRPVPRAVIACNDLHWVQHRRALADEWLFVKIYRWIYRDSVRHSDYRKCGLVREHALYFCMSSIFEII